MNKKEFTKRVNGVSVKPIGVAERVNVWNGTQLKNVFSYAGTCERCMEAMLAQVGKERKTTFTSDLSIGEWCEGFAGVLDTCKNVMRNWIDDEVFIAEFLLCVNWKSWEHDARGNAVWSKFYSDLYYALDDIVLDYHEGTDKAMYIVRYLD